MLVLSSPSWSFFQLHNILNLCGSLAQRSHFYITVLILLRFWVTSSNNAFSKCLMAITYYLYWILSKLRSSPLIFCLFFLILLMFPLFQFPQWSVPSTCFPVDSVLDGKNNLEPVHVLKVSSVMLENNGCFYTLCVSITLSFTV